MLGLPDHVTACLFDLDGVITQTAKVHNAAWTATFDEVLRERATADGTPFVPFDPQHDYNQYVDGKPREDGVRDFFASRGITFPEGAPDDPGDRLTVHGIGNRKNVLFLKQLQEHGVQAYEGSVRYLHAARDAGLRRAVVSASANCRDVVEAAGLTDLFEIRVDGVTLREKNLRGKPAPDSFLAAAAALGIPAKDAVVFEDAVSGVQAGHAGGFGYVVGVDRVDHAAELADNGADIVVKDLSDLLQDNGKA